MKKIITGLQNTMINNALNTSQAKNKTLPPPPAKRDPKANEAIYQANQAILAGVNRVVPPGSFEAPAVPRVYAPGYNPEPLSPELRMVQLNVKQPTQVIPGQVPPMPEPFNQVRRDDVELGYGSIRPEVVATVMGLGQGASKLAEAGGFYIAPPGADDTQDDYLNKALNDAEERYNKFTDEVKTAQDAKAAVDKKIVDVLKSTDTTVLQQSIADLVNQTKEISQKVTTARDFFVEKDPKSGKERFTNRGAAVVALQILSQFFGNPVQQTQLSGLITGLGSRYADEQNKLNEANFKAQLDAYNRKLQGYQAQIGVKQAEARQKLGILQFESEAEKEKLSTAKGLQRAQLDAVNSLTEKVSLEKVKAGSAEEKALVARAYTWLESGDPVFEAAARRVLQTRGYPVDIMPEAGKSMKEQERKIKMDYNRALADELKNKDAREKARLQLIARGIQIDEDKLAEQIRHNMASEAIGRANAAKSGGGGMDKLSILFNKEEILGTSKEAKSKIADIDRAMPGHISKYSAARRGYYSLFIDGDPKKGLTPQAKRFGNEPQARQVMTDAKSILDSALVTRDEYQQTVKNVNEATGLNLMVPGASEYDYRVRRQILPNVTFGPELVLPGSGKNTLPPVKSAADKGGKKKK